MKVKTLKSKKGKCVPITITREVQRELKEYKRRLWEMYDNDEVDEKEKRVIYIVLHRLDLYDRNILCAYYAVANSSPSQLAKILDIPAGVVSSRIRLINKKIKNMI